MDNLMHNTLEEIATWVRTVELPGTQSQQPETETFYEDDTTQEESPRTQKTRYHQGRKVVEAYLTRHQLLHLFLDQLGLVEREEAPLREIELKEVQEQLEGLIM
ncbi:hypothetical protein A1F94_012608 [Pyrenophora tritici-repentis]|nr:hypothetical protein A1F94_012608 [Pyrenophora tritici-repentis]